MVGKRRDLSGFDEQIYRGFQGLDRKKITPLFS